jgi:hypothetical protein
MLSHGRPFDSAHSDVFARRIVEHGALDFRPLPSAEAIGLAILREPAQRREAFFEALEKMPHGPPWDAELLAIWPEERRTQPLLEARVEPDSSSTPAFKSALVAKAIGELRDGSRHIEHATELIVASEREDALLTLDTRLVALYPATDVGRFVEQRLTRTQRDASRAALRATARTKALAVLTDDGRPTVTEERFRMAIRIVQAVEGRIDAPVLFSTLTARFPAHEPSHVWLTSHYRSAPPDARAALLTKARAHVNDGGVDGRRAAAMACHLLRDDGACPELASLRAVSPQDCPLPRRCAPR